jgi:cytochrome bd-type quinol oxidase subunit 1
VAIFEGKTLENGHLIPQDWLAIIFNPSFPYRLFHMAIAAFLFEGKTLRRLHPAIGGEDPEGGDQGAKGYHAGGKKMQSKVPPALHFFTTCMVALGTLVSTFWILASNSWMQTPQDEHGATEKRGDRHME